MVSLLLKEVAKQSKGRGERERGGSKGRKGVCDLGSVWRSSELLHLRSYNYNHFLKGVWVTSPKKVVVTSPNRHIGEKNQRCHIAEKYFSLSCHIAENICSGEGHKIILLLLICTNKKPKL